MMHTEIYCTNLDNIDKVKAIRAIHLAVLHLKVIEKLSSGFHVELDANPAIEALSEILINAGHIGFVKDKA